VPGQGRAKVTSSWAKIEQSYHHHLRSFLPVVITACNYHLLHAIHGVRLAVAPLHGEIRITGAIEKYFVLTRLDPARARQLTP
jgi:hypothetical protein